MKITKFPRSKESSIFLLYRAYDHFVESIGNYNKTKDIELKKIYQTSIDFWFFKIKERLTWVDFYNKIKYIEFKPQLYI